MTMIKRVADALAEAEGPDDGLRFNRMALAAIKAIREPTKEMIKEGLEAIQMNLDSTTDTNATYDIVVDGSAYHGWVAMIDAALTRPE